MTFLDHLEELRQRIFFSLIAVAITATAAFFFAPRVIDLLTRPVAKLVFLAPAEAFLVQLKTALVTGLVVAAPIVFYQFWRFIRPALHRNEARDVASAVFFSTVLFAGGLSFAYFVMIPFAMKFLLSYETGKLTAMISIDKYISTVGAFMLAAGLIFQMPVVIFFLTRLGVVSARWMLRNQRVAIVVILVIAAIVSPPDAFSQVMMAIPLLLLYELSVLVSFLARPRNVRGGQA